MTHHISKSRLVAALVAAFAGLLLGSGVLAPGAASAQVVEDYAGYQPQVFCAPKAKAGTTAFAEWLVRRHGGTAGGISRACSSGGVSEHKEGRAFDWMLDAASASDGEAAQAFLDEVFATDRAGNADAKARRMGIMYVIWNDRMYSAWDGFEPEPYLSSSCKTRKRCSKTLRHRDHVHVSLTRQAAKGLTSWYATRVTR